MLYRSLRKSQRVRFSPCFSHMLNSCDMLLALKPAQDEEYTDSTSSDDDERRGRPSQMTTPGSQIVRHKGTGMLFVCAFLLVYMPAEADSLCVVRSRRRLPRRGGRRSLCSPARRCAYEQRFCCDGRYVEFNLVRSCGERAGRSYEAERRLERRPVAFKLCAERFIFGLQPSPFGLGYSFERLQ